MITTGYGHVNRKVQRYEYSGQSTGMIFTLHYFDMAYLLFSNI